MSKRATAPSLNDIILSSEKILLYTNEMSFEEFCNDSKTIDAVIRNFEIIGEASNRLSDEFKDNHTSINWFRIRGMRNRLVHDYDGINFELIWDTIKVEIPELIKAITKIKNEL